MLTGGPVTLTNLGTQIKSLATKATAVNTTFASVLGPLAFGANSNSRSDNCTFIKYSLLSINAGLPDQQDAFQTIILLGLGVTSALMFINLTNCMMGQFRLADDKYYKEWQEMKAAESSAQSNLTDSKKPQSTTTKELPKLVASVVVSSNVDSKVALQPVPTSGPATERMSSIITEEKEKSAKVVPPKRDSVKIQPPQAINKIGPTVVGPRRIKPSSVAYNANFFAPKPVAKVKVVKAAEVEQALDDLRADNAPKTNKINEVDDAAVERIRNAGLFGEISRPLRPLK